MKSVMTVLSCRSLSVCQNWHLFTYPGTTSLSRPAVSVGCPCPLQHHLHADMTWQLLRISRLGISHCVPCPRAAAALYFELESLQSVSVSLSSCCCCLWPCRSWSPLPSRSTWRIRSRSSGQQTREHQHGRLLNRTGTALANNNIVQCIMRHSPQLEQQSSVLQPDPDSTPLTSNSVLRPPFLHSQSDPEGHQSHQLEC